MDYVYNKSTMIELKTKMAANWIAVPPSPHTHTHTLDISSTVT